MKLLVSIIFILIIGISFINHADSQVKNGYHDKLAVLYEEGEYLDCAFKAERMLLKDEYLSDPEVYLYLAICYNKIYQMTKVDPTLIQEEPEYAKAYDNALKYAADAKKKDKKAKEFFPDNNDLLEEIIYSGLPIADQYIFEKKYSKALALYRKFMKLVDNLHISFIKGVMDLYTLDKATANEEFSKVFTAIDQNNLPKNDNTNYLMKSGFLMYYEFLMQEDSVELADSAKHVLRYAVRVFPDDKEINQRFFPTSKQ